MLKGSMVSMLLFSIWSKIFLPTFVFISLEFDNIQVLFILWFIIKLILSFLDSIISTFNSQMVMIIIFSTFKPRSNFTVLINKLFYYYIKWLSFTIVYCLFTLFQVCCYYFLKIVRFQKAQILINDMTLKCLWIPK
jgi:hypothetical protein